ncbi:Imm26 family immunity protein [Sphingobacterium athyrii]|uniref:Uncharacterized protein n=1 Tax=Sphingobacterium athyrii TaxID=2152717 RepID=A0A363P075_9SPHI|nr:Imm26 family immunity protein [Sphingobacterium athyrii]PUV26311.1 hypothetical protein DCO56_04995 [Sphingobacterium athyrii]
MKIPIKLGTYFVINLGDYYVFGRIIEGYIFVFFDFQSSKEDIDLDMLLEQNILFSIHVGWAAITSKRWKVLAIKPLEEKFRAVVPFFVQEIGNDDLCWIDYNGERIQVSKIECIGFERLATWNAIHVEQRIRDHYDGKPNMYLLGLRLR